MAVTSTPAARSSGLAVAAGVLAAAVLAVAVNALIAMIAHAFGAAEEFQPLQFGSYAFLTVAGTLIAAAGWAAVRRWTRRPSAVLRWLVPAVLAVSFVPDLALLGSDAQPGTSGFAVVALIVMHVNVAAVAVPAFRRVLPLPDRR
jgi:hypothetical protein